MSAQSQVVVIGGGVVGAATAYYLATKNVPVVLAEKGKIGGEQSSRAWGFVRQQGRDPLELPLMVAANKLWPELSAELGADIEWTQKGILSIADTEERMQQLRDWVEVGRPYGVDTRIVSNKEIHELIPTIQGDFIGGMYTPSDGHAEPTKVPTAFGEAARRAGADVREYCAVERIEVAGGKVIGVETSQGYIPASTVVCAAGGWSARLARQVGIDLPQITVKNTAAETAPAPPITQIAVSMRGNGVAFRQRPGGTFYIATVDSSEFEMSLDAVRHARKFLPNYIKNRGLFSMGVGKKFVKEVAAAIPGSPVREPSFAERADWEPEPNLRLVGQTRAKLVRAFPELKDIKIRRAWAGMIDSTPDAVPVIGPVESPGGFILATGFSGHGFALGPIVGLVLSELIADGQPSIDISGLSFDRFAKGETAAPRSVI